MDRLIKITSVGTISIPKDLRRHLDLQKGDYVKVSVEGESMVVRKAVIS